ncbi:hypothetical protein [Nitrospira calida]
MADEYLDPDHFDGWPGLPVPKKPHKVPEAMPRAKLEGANLYLLGCFVDMNEFAWRAWSNVRKFFDSIPRASQGELWHWIADHHNEWNGLPKLHRYDWRHAKIVTIAQKLVRPPYKGDPRRIWEGRDGKAVLSILENDLRFGPQISRMTLGGLRDHKLVQMKCSDCKADVHVCRAMKALELSRTDKPADVEKAGKDLFADPWSVDGALWELGKDYEIEDLSDLERYYREMASWKRVEQTVKELVKGMIDELSAGLGERDGWALRYDPTHHWAGICLVKTEGPLKNIMDPIEKCKLWAWVGAGWYQTLVIAVEVGGEPDYFTTKPVGDWCKRMKMEMKMEEEKQTSSGRWGMRVFYGDRQVNKEDLQNRKWLINNLSVQLKRVVAPFLWKLKRRILPAS